MLHKLDDPMGRAFEDARALPRRTPAATSVLLTLVAAAGTLLAGCSESSGAGGGAKTATVFPGESGRGVDASSARGLAMTVLRHQNAANRASHSSFVVKSVSCVETDASARQFQCTTQYPNQSYVNLIRFGANNQPYTVRTLGHHFTSGSATAAGSARPSTTSNQNAVFRYSQRTIKQLDAVCSDWDHGSRCSSCIQPLQSARIPPSVAIDGLNEYLESSITDSAGQTVFNAEANDSGNSC
jgi:hypothetical protein